MNNQYVKQITSNIVNKTCQAPAKGQLYAIMMLFLILHIILSLRGLKIEVGDDKRNKSLIPERTF